MQLDDAVKSVKTHNMSQWSTGSCAYKRSCMVRGLVGGAWPLHVVVVYKLNNNQDASGEHGTADESLHRQMVLSDPFLLSPIQ